MTAEEVLNIKINIAQEQLTVADSEESKKRLTTRIKKLKLQKEIEIIKRKIQQLS